MDNYWTEENQRALVQAASYHDLKEIALDVLSRFPRQAMQVCGPISTGGKGNRDANIREIADAVQVLSLHYLVFDQTPFEGPMLRLKQGNGYNQRVLDEFYLPVFESGHIDTFTFLPDWQTSTGARWENAQAERLKIERWYLPHLWREQFGI
jgi:hypothetical protein